MEGPNYTAVEALVAVRRDDDWLALLAPQKRRYRVQQDTMTEADIDANLARDLFVALGDSLGEGAWSMRIQVKPMIQLIWLGAVIMALGGGLAASDRRYRVRERASETEPSALPAGATDSVAGENA